MHVCMCVKEKQIKEPAQENVNSFFTYMQKDTCCRKFILYTS